MTKLPFILTAIFLLFLLLSNIIIIIVSAQKDQLKVSSSSKPQHFTRYLSNNPEGVQVVGSTKECYGSANISQREPQSNIQHQPSGNLTIKVHLNVTGFEETLETTLPVDVVIAIDSSRSMEQNDRDNLRLEVAKELINNTDVTRGDKIALVSFDDEIEYASPLVSDPTLIKTEIDDIDSFGDTNLDIGLNSSISILDQSTRAGPSSKAIIFFSDGEERYTPSGKEGSLSDLAKANRYKIFPVGLNVEQGSNEESYLINMANTTDGTYYAQPSKDNMQKLFNEILQTSDSRVLPTNVDVQTVMQSYVVVDKNSFNIQPTSIRKNLNNETILIWENISKYVGNQNELLSQNETFKVTFLAEIPPNTTAYPRIRLPLFVDGESVARYADSSGKVNVTLIPPLYINVNFIKCPEQKILPKEPLRILLDTFIVPSTFNNSTTVDLIQQRKSNIFKPNETIEFYVEAAGVTKKAIIDESTGRTHYLSYTTANFTITDEKGNLVSPHNASFSPLVEISNTTFSNYSHTFRYDPNLLPPLQPGNYIMNFTITDNFSGETETIPKDIVIEDLRVLLSALIAPGSTTNREFGQFDQYSSNEFLPNQTIEFYVEFAGMTPKFVNESTNIPYMINVSGALQITDQRGNVRVASVHGENFLPFHIDYRSTRTSNSSYVFGFEPSFPPPLEPGNYIMNFTITDNFSKRKIDTIQNIVILNSDNIP